MAAYSHVVNNKTLWGWVYSGAPLIYTLLAPSIDGRIMRFPLFKGYWYNAGVAYSYFQWCNVTCDLK